MNERDIFMAALEKVTAEERSDYLGVACAGDTTLRERVEGLLQMHQQTGDFLQKPLVERLAEGVAALEEAQTAHPSLIRTRSSDLGFLRPSDQPGSLGRLGHYEVQEVIGSGGMGIVLRAFDERLHRVVAIKVMAAPLATNAASRKRFQREARAAAAVCHDHIVTIHAVEDPDELPYLVMQCISGMSLQERIDRDGPLALHEILRIGMQTAAGLTAAHAQGLIHRDIKPANILLENGVERVKITDFGLARAAADASISQTGIAAGTPQYMSPEQARGESVDCRTDLFSLGSVLYAMCTGRAPFRAGNSMAVLKRVCDDAPSSIHEANADVPDWLIALIDKLQAKNPDDRYQSAAEVAQILGQRLARLQHSTPIKPVAQSGIRNPQSAIARTWALPAAAALVLLLLGISLTEATGVTQVVPTVIRMVSGEGTLVVETDPDVQVTVEGNGDLVFNLAGGQSIRLPTGPYRMTATKDGRAVPLEKDLVTISRDREQIVRVRFEREPVITAAPKAEKGAFVVLDTKGGEVGKLDTLAEAIGRTSDGDTIEVRGHGPFVTEPVNVPTPTLTIRAGRGFRPVIRLSQQASEAFEPMLSATGEALTLEGLDFQRLGQREPKAAEKATVIVSTRAAVLHVANCRFVLNHPGTCVHTTNKKTRVVVVRNCEFFSQRDTVVWFYSPQGRLTIDNSVHVAKTVLLSAEQDLAGASIALRHNTMLGRHNVWLVMRREPAALDDHAQPNPIRVAASSNLFDAQNAVLLCDQSKSSKPLLDVTEAEALLRQTFAWQDDRNLYPQRRLRYGLLGMSADAKPLETTWERDLAGWQQFWGSPGAEALSGHVRYEGGDLFSKAASNPEQLTAADFRLRPDSAGYRAGPDGKDLGADVDLVGPGAPYEMWKTTPEYQQWLKETGQVK
jgi:hypothetical protein